MEAVEFDELALAIRDILREMSRETDPSEIRLLAHALVDAAEDLAMLAEDLAGED